MILDWTKSLTGHTHTHTCSDVHIKYDAIKQNKISPQCKFNNLNKQVYWSLLYYCINV